MSSADASRITRLIQDISTETVLLHQEVADRLGLNLTDHKCLGFLLEAGTPLTGGDLARLTGLTTGAITGAVDRLQRGGFVRRRRDSRDRRRVYLELNVDKVSRELAPLFEPLGRRMSALAESYGAAERAVIADFMEQGLAISRQHRARLAKPAR